MRVIVRMRRNPAAIVRVVRLIAIDVQRASTTDRTFQHGGTDRLVDDLADGAGAAAALRATAEASVDMAGRTTSRTTRGVAHLMVGQHVAGANNHRAGALFFLPMPCQLKARPRRVK